MNDLAIVIPAYKNAFLNESLRSLANQTNKNFNIYIGDDCSPYSLKKIVDKYNGVLPINYHRFENNIGAKHLVKQWNRCIELTKDESWLWLFSDDDIADADCVQAFYETRQKDNGSFDVYRFNTRILNNNNGDITDTPESPFIDSSYNMAIEILKGNRGNSMPDHIFSRAVYNKYGGFVCTDYAQAADWATSILFSSEKGICTIHGPKINWRISNQNISGLAAKNKKVLLKGYLQFLEWILNHFKHRDDTLKYKNIVEVSKANLLTIINTHYKGLALCSILDVYCFYKKNYKPNKPLLHTLRLYFRKRFNS